MAYFTHIRAKNDIATAIVLIVGTIMFAAIFAVNSSVHSYLIVSYSNKVGARGGRVGEGWGGGNVVVVPQILNEPRRANSKSQENNGWTPKFSRC